MEERKPDQAQDLIEENPSVEPKGLPVTRRAFLKVAAATGATAAAAATGCLPSPQARARPTPTPVMGLDDKYLHVPPAPTAQPKAGQYRFFNAEEARALEAFVARILPGTPDDPGALEAGVPTFIDAMLATAQTWAEPTYLKPPFAKTYAGETLPPEAAQSDPRQEVWVNIEELERYGYQGRFTPHEIYRLGLRALNDFARSQFGGAFADLSEDQQDDLVGQIAEAESPPDVEGGKTGGSTGLAGFSDVSASTFFEVVQQHLIFGMFGDPLYGGNREFAGWRLVGYPGAQRAYTVADMHNESFSVEPQSLAHLPPFHPGQLNRPEVILPAAGSRNPQPQAAPPAESGWEWIWEWFGGRR